MIETVHRNSNKIIIHTSFQQHGEVKIYGQGDQKPKTQPGWHS